METNATGAVIPVVGIRKNSCCWREKWSGFLVFVGNSDNSL